MKDSIAYKTLDNITVVLLAFNNLKQALVDELISGGGNHEPEEKDNQVGGSRQEDQQSVSNEQTPNTKASPNQNEKIDNSDSSNGGLVYSENKGVIHLSN